MRPRVGWGGAALFALAATLVVSIGIGVPSYWSDEGATVRVSALPPADLVGFLAHGDAVHGLYYLVMHGWTLAFGDSEGSTRLLSALAVGLTAGALLVLGRLVATARIGLVAGVVFVLMPRTTFAATEARSFALSALVAVVATILFVLAFRDASVRRSIAYVAVCVVGVWLFVYLALLVVAHAVAAVVLDRRAALRLTPAFVAIGVLSAPIGIVAASQRSQISWLAEQDVLNPWMVWVEPWAPGSWGFGAAIALLLAAGAVRWRTLWGTHRVPVAICLAWVGVPWLVIVSVSLTFVSMYTPRYLTFGAPGMALLLAIALTAVFDRRWQVFALVALAAISLPTAIAQRLPYAKNGGSDLREIAEVVTRSASPGDGIYFEPADAPTRSAREALAAYPAAFAGLDDLALATPFPESGTVRDRTRPLSAVDRDRLLAPDRLWFIGASTDCADMASIEQLARRVQVEVRSSHATHRNLVCEVAVRPGEVNAGEVRPVD